MSIAKVLIVAILLMQGMTTIVYGGGQHYFNDQCCECNSVEQGRVSQQPNGMWELRKADGFTTQFSPEEQRAAPVKACGNIIECKGVRSWGAKGEMQVGRCLLTKTLCPIS